MAVSKTGSLTAAAKLLFITQPAVSQQLNVW
ncbi:MAG: LysR family transcriptional regulator, partial [Limosilactobacillus mucosae]|nr:LysR family transcriptional regulator [Limosilactobacillus mucosae]